MLILAMRERYFKALRDYGEDGHMGELHCLRRATREVLLSRQNPYYAAGTHFSGVGGPHVDAYHPWPMWRISAIFGPDDNDEILGSRYLIANASCATPAARAHL